MDVKTFAEVLGAQLINEYFDVVAEKLPEFAGVNVGDLALAGIAAAISLGTFSTGRTDLDTVITIAGLGRAAKIVKEKVPV